MRRPLILVSTLMLLAAGPMTGSVHAQWTEPFSMVEFRASGTQNMNKNFLHDFWDQGFGGELSIATPFYLGYAEAGGAFHRYRVAQPTVPAFNALLFYAGWGLGTDLGSVARIEGGARIGNYRMSFDEDTFTGVKNESELALMLHTRLAVRPFGPVSLHVSGSYMQVYTFVRLKLWYVSAGLSYRMRSPRWLKEMLN
ncbi:MAG: hypothetical protein ACE5G0_23230 [Rhodothermales bacterium]